MTQTKQSQISPYLDRPLRTLEEVRGAMPRTTAVGSPPDRSKKPVGAEDDPT